MTDEFITRPEFNTISGMIQDHHKRVRDIEKTLEHTPDPKTLRDMEHIYKELPNTDDIKECVNDHTDRKMNIKRWIWGIIAVVSTFVAISLIRVLWVGIGKVIVSTGGLS